MEQRLSVVIPGTSGPQRERSFYEAIGWARRRRRGPRRRGDATQGAGNGADFASPASVHVTAAPASAIDAAEMRSLAAVSRA